ncbi:hypothetical protein B0J11DRAFT_57775 [Dendryphion nanum]|uniref:Uncharacterized protein n=1 Tax=Dendryphion nanum TaxID=256645 RepID=A0A9P9DKZ7_9PLEO|nr:hypothetical protein B0J11DRAFT_57775 [Dendryphion nanum]
MQHTRMKGRHALAAAFPALSEVLPVTLKPPNSPNPPGFVEEAITPLLCLSGHVAPCRSMSLLMCTPGHSTYPLPVSPLKSHQFTLQNIGIQTRTAPYTGTRYQTSTRRSPCRWSTPPALGCSTPLYPSKSSTLVVDRPWRRLPIRSSAMRT